MIIDFTRQPNCDELKNFMMFGVRINGQFNLVVYENKKLTDRGKILLSALKSYLINSRTTSEWPGTKLTRGYTAILNTYWLNPDSLAIIENTSLNLYNWIYPDLPEDLCILRNDGTPFFISIAHEKEAYLKLNYEELEAIQRMLPSDSNLLQNNKGNNDN